MTILEALADPNLLGAAFPDLTTWSPWTVALKAVFGLPMMAAEQAVFTTHTSRPTAPTSPAREAWFIVGRRGGKSRMAAVLAVFIAAFRAYADVLAPGEKATIAVIAADRLQARVVLGYIAAFFDQVPMLRPLVVRRTAHTLELRGNVVIEVHTSSFRSTRGYSFAAVIADEVAFWKSETSASPDVEVLNAVRPGLATIPGSLLVCISSPYSRKGALWRAYKDHHGRDGDPVLIWQAATRAMNPTLPEYVVEDAMAADEASARAEYLGEFRRDLEPFVALEVLEACVVVDRLELPPVSTASYAAFVDPSGGSQDAMTLAIGHCEGDTVVVDALRERKPPFSPDAVVTDFAALLKSYGVTRVTGDRYGGEWPRERFQVAGITYEPAERPKSELYRDLLPFLNSTRVELLDHPRLHAQLLGLERRTARGGRDSIDHAPGAHDDLANVVAGLVGLLAQPGVPGFLGWLRRRQPDEPVTTPATT